MTPTVEIVHSRNPDSDCDITVIIDGHIVNPDVFTVDPGAGWDQDDWHATAAQFPNEYPNATPTFARTALAAHSAYNDNEWISGSATEGVTP